MTACDPSGANKLLYQPASFSYRVAHCDSAVSPHTRALYRRTRAEIQDDFDSFHLAFGDYFSNWPGIHASFENLRDVMGISLDVKGGTRASVEIIVQHFLERFNSAHPGLGLVVVRAEAAVEPQPPLYS